jgi:hypothetical protein
MRSEKFALSPDERYEDATTPSIVAVAPPTIRVDQGGVGSVRSAALMSMSSLPSLTVTG